MKVFLKETARTRGLSLYKLAQLLELPGQTIYSWASGRTQPNYDNMDRLCTILDCKLDDIFQIEKKTEDVLEKRLAKAKKRLSSAYQDYKNIEQEMQGA